MFTCTCRFCSCEAKGVLFDLESGGQMWKPLYIPGTQSIINKVIDLLNLKTHPFCKEFLEISMEN